MKTLQERVKIVYRFRCDTCRSKFEMTEEEKIENDWKFTNYIFSKEENKWICGPVNRDKDFISNPLRYFDCPVCKRVRNVKHGEMHKYSVMNDGTEIMNY